LKSHRKWSLFQKHQNLVILVILKLLNYFPRITRFWCFWKRLHFLWDFNCISHFPPNIDAANQKTVFLYLSLIGWIFAKLKNLLLIDATLYFVPRGVDSIEFNTKIHNF
jgi:hypothetical protein